MYRELVNTQVHIFTCDEEQAWAASLVLLSKSHWKVTHKMLGRQ